MNKRACADRVLTTGSDIFMRMFFEINRKPLQSDKYSGHISLFLGIKMKDKFPF